MTQSVINHCSITFSFTFTFPFTFTFTITFTTLKLSVATSQPKTWFFTKSSANTSIASFRPNKGSSGDGLTDL